MLILCVSVDNLLLKFSLHSNLSYRLSFIFQFNDLSNGSIDEITNMSKRIDWWKNIYFKEVKEILEEIEDSYKKLH